MPSESPAVAEGEIFGPPLAWWLRETAARMGELPSRRDLRPEDHLGTAPLPYVVLVDVADGGARLRFRLVGSHHVEMNGRDLRGMSFEDAFPDGPAFAYVRDLYRDLVALRRPLWTVNLLPNPRTGHELRLERLMLPLSGDGVVIDGCLAVQRFHRAPFEEADAPTIWRRGPAVVEVERRVL